MAISSRLEPSTLSERVVQYVVEYIRERELQPGDKMPSEMQISADLKISRGIVREAYRSLSAAGVLEVGAGRSPKVGALNNALLTHVMRHALSTRQVSAEQVLDLRCSIEVRAAELAAEMCTLRDVTDLRSAVSGMKRGLKSPDRWVQHDIRFHEIISGATGNPLFRLLVGTLRESMETSIRAGLENRTNRVQLTRIVETHSAIVDAIASRQATRAGYIMKVHFDEAKDALRGVATPKRQIVDQAAVIAEPSFLVGQNI
jgi:GntR family transcriptional regulator, transcriptional repressor for pyruvate dehydrogenase complex